MTHDQSKSRNSILDELLDSLCGEQAGYETAGADEARHIDAEIARLRREIHALFAVSEQQPRAYIEHHKGGDNLVWERTKLPCTPLCERNS